MKVIAKIDGNKMLCEIDVTELALLHGFRSSYDTGFNKDKATSVGAECNIKQVDDTMETVGSLESFNILSDEEQIGD